LELVLGCELGGELGLSEGCHVSPLNVGARLGDELGIFVGGKDGWELGLELGLEVGWELGAELVLGCELA